LASKLRSKKERGLRGTDGGGKGKDTRSAFYGRKKERKVR